MNSAGRRGIRIGMVNYINTAPIYETWKTREHPSTWQMVEQHPAALTRMLAEGGIDMGFVSSHEYGMRPGRYRILEDLSISANGPVGSVFLFSRYKPEKLGGLTVLMSAQSKTSVCLVRIVLEKFFNVTPDYISGAVGDGQKLGADGVLAIGDDALRLKIEGSYQYCLDLGEAWKLHTGLPFVFAVCAVQDELCRQHPELVHEVHRELITCRDIGLRELDTICRLAAPRVPMEVPDCRSYLTGIEYNLGPAKHESLELFFGYLIELGQAEEDAVPLRFMELEQRRETGKSRID